MDFKKIENMPVKNSNSNKWSKEFIADIKKSISSLKGKEGNFLLQIDKDKPMTIGMIKEKHYKGHSKNFNQTLQTKLKSIIEGLGYENSYEKVSLLNNGEIYFMNMDKFLTKQ